jgi:hypothetical protein
MLHIHNGESTAGTLREARLPGEHFSFNEVLMEGPAPAGLTPEQWRKHRAGFLAAEYDIELEKCERELLNAEKLLASFKEHDEVVLWFEHDLFCQVNLVYLLSWFSRQEPAPANLRLICVDRFPGMPGFRGLGELTGSQLTSLFGDRKAVSAEQFSLAARVWAAYCAPTPETLAGILSEDTSSLPFLRAALQLHLERFPSVENGLGRIENRALDLIAQGNSKFKNLFPAFANLDPVYGLGDAQFWNCLRRLTEVNPPLLEIQWKGSARQGPENDFLGASFALTDTGDAVRTRAADLVDTCEFDFWLGGVHLNRSLPIWRWDVERGLRAED